MSDLSKQSFIFVTCAGGVEPILERELRALGYKPEAVRPLGVALRGTMDDCLHLNLHLRTAHRVLYELRRFKAENPDELYAELVTLPWEELIAEDGYLSVVSSVDNPTIRDARFANLRVKDAVVDRIGQRCSRRPDSGPDRNGVVLSLHWQGRTASISLDTTGDPLSNRGYRTIPHTAPMRESIAAASLFAADYNGKGHLVNPMCGSGTLAIEAALLATGTAPGLLRKHFAFMHLLPFDPDRWAALRAQAREQVRNGIGGSISATDHDPAAMEAARINAMQAGMSQYIAFETCDFRETEVPYPNPRVVNLFIANPEYGKRLSNEQALEPVYTALGDFMKQHCRGYTGAVFTGNLRLAKKIGLRTRARVPLMSGPLDCRLLLFDLYAGTRKTKDEA